MFSAPRENCSPVTTGQALQRGLGFIVIFFPSSAAGRKEQFKCKCCKQCRQCCAAPQPAMERWGGPMDISGQTNRYMDGPMDVWMVPFGTHLWGWHQAGLCHPEPPPALRDVAFCRDFKMPKYLRGSFVPQERRCAAFWGKVSQFVYIYFSAWKGNLLFPPSSEALQLMRGRASR